MGRTRGLLLLRLLVAGGWCLRGAAWTCRQRAGAGITVVLRGPRFAACAAEAEAEAAAAAARTRSSEEEERQVQALVDTRAAARRRGDFSSADAVKQQLEDTWGVLLRDAADGTTAWAWRPRSRPADAPEGNSPSTVQLAHQLVRAALAPGTGQERARPALLADISSRVARWRRGGATDLHGRKFADVAFLLAMAGVVQDDLFQALADGDAPPLPPSL